ncbi:hypothetical protein CFter6_4198 [Collimonas fungivorans]|uniref:Uncharacterized protein n=1 Tax=Collimonas fungivorans TaxID=158899 RepID=A0A127PG64_9BURK|nr:hypothetical protein CFter6_4198 [Collimonas fungivorans]
MDCGIGPAGNCSPICRAAIAYRGSALKYAEVQLRICFGASRTRT